MKKDYQLDGKYVHLVFNCFEQIYGKDYTKTTSPTARMESWCILPHIAASLNWDAQQVDVKTCMVALSQTALIDKIVS